ncbi:MAG: glycosyltransferase, partial [Candidatus Hydrogenedentes bacterium]|nr:glycosyltransferase [Candidatus Hydrogenedentota bacterium]
MRLLIVADRFDVEQARNTSVARALAARGHRIAVVTSGGQGQPVGAEGLEVLAPLTRTEDRRRQRAVGRRNGRHVRDTLAAARPDAVVLWNPAGLAMGAVRAAVASGIPTVTCFVDDDWAALIARPFRWSLRPALAFLADRTINRNATLAAFAPAHATCVSRYLKAALVAQGVPAQHARVLYPGIPLEAFPAKPRPGALHLPLRILCSPLPHPAGLDTVIEAAGHIVEARRAGALEVTILADDEAVVPREAPEG